MDFDRLKRELEERITRIKVAQGIARALVEARSEVRMTRSVRRFKNFAEQLEKALDRHVDAAMDELTKKHGTVVEAVTTVKTHLGKTYDAGTDDALDMLNQMTNGDPTDEESEGSGASS
jgi:hypothetical protein